MTANLQCPLDPFVINPLKNKMNFALLVQAIENHISSSSCFHPPLKDIVYHGDLDGSTPLLVACHYGELEVVKRIVEGWGVDARAAATYYPCYYKNNQPRYYPSDEKIENATSLFVAALNGHIEIVRYLLTKDADVFAVTSTEGNPGDYGGITPLQAALSGRYESEPKGLHYEDYAKKESVIGLLLDAGANLSTLHPRNGLALWSFCGIYGNIDLIKRGIDVKLRNSQGETILHNWIWLTLSPVSRNAVRN